LDAVADVDRPFRRYEECAVAADKADAVEGERKAVELSG